MHLPWAPTARFPVTASLSTISDAFCPSKVNGFGSYCFVSNALNLSILRSPPWSKNGADERKLRVTYSAENLLFSRRPAIICTGVALISIFTLSSGLIPSPAKAEETNRKAQEDEGDSGVLGAMKSLFDPNEKTKSGKVLPKAYLKDAREVVKTLRESLEEDTKDVARFRRTADAAKEAIREYLNSWTGQQAVKTEESYVALEKAIRSLANFYSKAGPFGMLPEDVKNSILDALSTAEANL